MKKYFVAGFFCLFLMLTLCACAITDQRTQKIKDLEYTLVRDYEVPQTFLDKIEEQKQDAFKLTYFDGEALYIAKGYGKQETGGYSITMKELYLTENAIYFATDFCGPKKGENVTEGASYPYIVVKTEMIDKPVVFE